MSQQQVQDGVGQEKGIVKRGDGAERGTTVKGHKVFTRSFLLRDAGESPHHTGSWFTPEQRRGAAAAVRAVNRTDLWME